jgi:hypothetical protein
MSIRAKRSANIELDAASFGVPQHTQLTFLGYVLEGTKHNSIEARLRERQKINIYTPAQPSLKISAIWQVIWCISPRGNDSRLAWREEQHMHAYLHLSAKGRSLEDASNFLEKCRRDRQQRKSWARNLSVCKNRARMASSMGNSGKTEFGKVFSEDDVGSISLLFYLATTLTISTSCA